jgi:hypothetical protein
MKQITLTIFAVSLFLFSCNNNGEKTDATKTDASKATEQPVAKDAAPAAVLDSATKAKNWQSYMTTADMHKMMASWNGNWTSEITIWEKPGAPPMTSTGSCVNKMVLGGRYQESSHSSTMMGMPFEGHGTLGYDNAKKVFESVWIDNMGTGVIKMTGPWDAATKSVTLTGKMVDPATLTETDFKEVFTVVDDNTQMMAMYVHDEAGKEFKVMEMKFSRKK